MQKKSNKNELTLSRWSKENKTIVQILAIALNTQCGIISKLEIEVESSTLERIKENGVRRFK